MAARSPNAVELWQSYVASKATSSEEEAFRIYVGALSHNATRELASEERDTSNALSDPTSSIAFGDISCERVDEEVARTLEERCQLLVQQMLSTSLQNGIDVDENLVVYTEHISHVLFFYGLWGRDHSKSGKLCSVTLALCASSHKLLHVVTSEGALRHLLVAMRYLLGFVHHVLDPDHRWKHLFLMSNNKDYPSHSSQEDIQEVPKELSQLFISVFKDPPLPPLCPTELSSMQMEMLHVIGAAATGLTRTATVLATSEVINQLIAILHPSRNSGCGPMQALALKVFIKVLHVLHCFMPKEEQVEVDTGVTLSKLLNVLPFWLQEEHKHSSPTFFVVLLNSIPLLVDSPMDSGQLKELFAELGCFEKMVESLKQLGRLAGEGLGRQLLCSLFRAFTAILKDSLKVKESFKQHLEYTMLKELTSTLLTKPTEDILTGLLKMALEDVSEGPECPAPLVCNADALGLCLEWLLDLPHNLQVWLSTRVLDLCSSSVYNKQQCCGARLASVAVQVLMRSQEAGGFAEEIEDNLLRLIEGLGTHSIMGTELKDMLVSLRPVKCGETLELPTYYFKLQYVLSALAKKENGTQSLYYFELRQPNSQISISGLHRWPKENAFSFHCWVSLDRSCADADQRNMRRMLYSFYAGSTGFEAFFTKDLILVVAVHSKKKGFQSISVTEPLSPQEWHAVCVTHSTSKKPWSGKNETAVYIDGMQKAYSTELRVPDLCAEYNHCDIGFCQNEADISPSLKVMGDEHHKSFGPAISMFGRISSIYIFSEALQLHAVQLLHKNGPNNLSLFQPKYPDTEALISKLVLFFHPKACKGNTCVDLCPSHAMEGAMEGNMVGEVYVTRDVQLVLSSLGGVEVFFPILEQAGLHLKHREICSINIPISNFEPWNDEQEAVTYFIRLMTSMLTNTPTNEQVFFVVGGPATIGALLQKVPPSLLTVTAHRAVQSLVQQLTRSSEQPEQQGDLYSSLLFNYRIWSRADYSVQLSHSKYLSTLVSEKLEYCRRDFGVQFVLDIIREYYNPSSAINPKLNTEEKYHIRESLMSIINLYIGHDIMDDEVDAMLGFLSAMNDPTLLDEVLRFLLGLLTTPTHQDALSTALWERGVVFLILIQTQDFDVRLTTLRILTQLSLKQGNIGSGVVYNTLHSGAFAAAMCQNEQCLPSSIILALLDLCVVKNSEKNKCYISNFDVYVATLRLLRTASMSIRHTICQDCISNLHSNSDLVAKLAESHGWERLLLWLLTPCKSDLENPTETESATSETFDVVMNTIGSILWHCIIPEQWEGQLRQVCGQFMSALDLFATEQKLIVPVHLIKQKVFLLLMNAVTLECSSVQSRIPENVLPSVVCQLSQLLEAFIISSYPSCDVEEDLEVVLQKFSHNVVLMLNKEHCSKQLLEYYWDMLTAAHMLEGPIEPALMQSVLRILLASACSDDAEYCQYGCKLLELQLIEASDAVCVLRHIATQFSSDQLPTARATLIQQLFQCYGKKQLVPLPSCLPDLTSETFVTKLVEYSKRDEWHTWLGELQAKQMQHSEVVYKWLKDLLDHNRQCKQDCLTAETKRKELVFSDLEKYQITVSQLFYSQRESELSRQKTLDNQYRQELSATLQRWSGTRRFLTGECGAWKNRDPDLYLWKMDRTENFSRMRLKLARNYNYNKHTDASQCSSGKTPLAPSTADTSLLAMATATKSSSEEEEEHLFDQIQKLARDEPSVALEKGKKEKLMIRETCQLVTVVEVISGTLDITNKCIYFLSDPQDKDYVSWYPIDFKIPHSQLREIHPRRYNMSHTAMEIFLVDRSNHFLNFASKKSLRSVFSCILQLDASNLIKGSLTQKPAKLVQSFGLTQKWVRREITNFDYIMQLNTISGRTYNDLNQYPIFPWILRDYSSDTLDLSNPEVFRDLSKPMGIQNPDLVERIRAKYEELEDPVMGKFHYGTHYSNAANVIYYMVRLEPFTTLQIKLQSGMFDHPDRQFFSIPNAWRITYLGSDVKELIPEFFCLPDFLRNINGYDLGVTQSNNVVGDVILPKWASSPEDFIRQHREALESEYVSAHLNEWIDLIFGYKQTGPEAEKAMNVFNKYSYQENVNLDNIPDPKSRREIESIINNFGQTPTRLFNEKHPFRGALELSLKSYRGYASPFTGKKAVVSLFEHMYGYHKGERKEVLMANSVEVIPDDPIVFIGSPGMQSRALIVSGNPETLVTISQSGLLGTHGWLPFSNSKQRSFTFHPDTSTSSDKSKCPCLGGPFDRDLHISSHLFALSSNNKLLLSAGHWDNSFRTYSLEKNKMVARTMHHTAVVTCMAVDRLGTEDLLITGSKDTTCVIWKFSKQDPPSRPQQTLYGHDAEVLCVDICSELDLAISGAKNGICLVHTIRSGQLVHKLIPKKSCEIRHVAVSTTGVMVVYSVGSRSTGAAAVDPYLHLYSINGKLLEEKKLSKSLNTIVIEGKWIITGNEQGFLTFRDLFSFKQRYALDLNASDLRASIHSISPVLDHQTKLCTHLLVGLQNGKLIIVSPKESSVT